MSQAALDAFETAKQIRILFGELHEQLGELGKDASITTQQRHLAIKQICDVAVERTGLIEDYAKDFLDNNVEKVSRIDVPGIELEIGGLFVAGMVYATKPVHKIEILNKDDDSWGKLLIALVNSGNAKAVQKRLTVSNFVGPNGERALEAAAGLIACTTEETWSITKPKPKK